MWLWHVPNARAIRRSTLFKNAKGRPFYFSCVQRFLVFIKSKFSQAVNLSTWEIFVSRMSPLDGQIVRGPITANA